MFQGLFHINERVVYTGSWAHGFFSMSAVGATNVGCIRVGCDPELNTNCQGKDEAGSCKEASISAKSSKGEYFGEFNLGSTIVLVFEAPDKLDTSIVSGMKIKMGEEIFKLPG